MLLTKVTKLVTTIVLLRLLLKQLITLTSKAKNANKSVIVSNQLMQERWTQWFNPEVWLPSINICSYYGKSKLGASHTNLHHMPSPPLRNHKNHIRETLQLAMIWLELLFANLPWVMNTRATYNQWSKPIIIFSCRWTIPRTLNQIGNDNYNSNKIITSLSHSTNAIRCN